MNTGPERERKSILDITDTLIIGSDHGGWKLRDRIKSYLLNMGLGTYDVGTHDQDASCDHPVIAQQVAYAIASGEYDAGILVCGSGEGMSVAANRFPGVRATILYSDETAKLSRQHNDSNLAVFGERTMDNDAVLRRLELWLNEPFLGDKYDRRNEQIDAEFERVYRPRLEQFASQEKS